jgi:hypothetical protein
MKTSFLREKKIFLFHLGWKKYISEVFSVLAVPKAPDNYQMAFPAYNTDVLDIFWYIIELFVI